MNTNQAVVRVFRTVRDTGERLVEGTPLTLEQGLQPALPSVLIDSGTRYQEIEGFGGSFTEAAAVTLFKMSRERRAEVLRAYFDVEEGHGYTLCRTHINSCDFALGNYAYSEVEGDVQLEHFYIARDRRALIPLIQAAQEVAGGRLNLLASPWSPPAWMKTNGHMNYGG